jgi:hypothetical protein
MPKIKEMDKLAREAAVRRSATPDPAPGAPMPDQMWNSVLTDPRESGEPKYPAEQCALADIKHHVLRVECQRCLRIVEIQKANAIRFYGERAIWKEVGQRLLDQTCTNRTGRHEEDRCWPSWATQ